MASAKNYPKVSLADRGTSPIADWPEFVAAVAYLSRPNRVLIARICRRLEEVQSVHGDDIAEAAVERIIRALACEGERYLS